MKIMPGRSRTAALARQEHAEKSCRACRWPLKGYRHIPTCPEADDVEDDE